MKTWKQIKEDYSTIGYNDESILDFFKGQLYQLYSDFKLEVKLLQNPYISKDEKHERINDLIETLETQIKEVSNK